MIRLCIFTGIGVASLFGGLFDDFLSFDFLKNIHPAYFQELVVFQVCIFFGHGEKRMIVSCYYSTKRLPKTVGLPLFQVF